MQRHGGERGAIRIEHLSATTPYVLPSMSSWIDPIIGNEPLITAPPAVVGGVVQ